MQRRLRFEPLETRALLTALFTVNTTADTVNADPGNGDAFDTDGYTSLRAAVMEANALRGSHEIQLDEGIYQLSITSSNVNNDASATDLDILPGADITVVGAGAELTTIDAQELFRIFHVHSGATLNVRDVRLTGGRISSTDDGGGGGGAILVSGGALKLSDSTVAGNSGLLRGAIDVNSGSATIAGTLFQDNFAGLNNHDGFGGAISQRSSEVTVDTSQFIGNSTSRDGGAVYNLGGSTMISNSELRGNFVGESLRNPSGAGGAIYNAGTMELSDVSVIENAAGYAGGVRNRAKMTIQSSHIADNRSVYTGGGISNFTGGLKIDASLSITASTVSGNTGTYGAGLWSDSPTVIINSIFQHNRASDNGGAISNAGEAMLKLAGSTLAENTARFGGAILSGSAASLELVNSTVSGNAARAGGGGISSAGTLSVTHSTITGNRADSNDGEAGIGGGLRALEGSATLHNTIVAGNLVGTAAQPDDVAGQVDSTSAFNLIGDSATSGGLNDGDNGNMVGDGGSGTLPITSILDTSLGDNGGPTPTHALLRGSPAIGAAITLDDVTTDQRGLPRPVGESPDIGAYEVQADDPGFNSAPTALDDFYTLLAGERFEVDPESGVLANDSDPEDDPLTALLVDGPQSGSLEWADDGSFSYHPDEGFVGSDSFTYRAFDGLLESNLAVVTLEVHPVTEAVAIDIQPGDDSNTIDLAHTWLTVAILGNNSLDVTQINVDSLRFGASGSENSIERDGRGAKATVVFELVDVNDNGHVDLVVRFEVKRTKLKVGDSEATLTGTMGDGEAFSISQYVNVISSGGNSGRGNGNPGRGNGNPHR